MQKTTSDILHNSQGGRGEQEVTYTANQTAIFYPQQEQPAAPWFNLFSAIFLFCQIYHLLHERSHKECIFICVTLP